MVGSIFKIKNYGLLELLMASLIILCQYRVGPIPMSFVLCPLMAVMAFVKKRRIWGMREYYLFVAYFFLHEILLFVTMNTVPPYHLNHILGIGVFVISLVFIIPALDYKKLVPCIALVSIIVSLGILYHFVLLRSVSEVQTIALPFLSTDEVFGERELTRPTSFFTEPSYYAIYMMVPLFLSLVNRKYIITAVIVGMVFLSTSITGVVGCFIIFTVYFLSKKGNKIKAFVIIAASVAIMGYMLINLDIFSGTSQKLENQSSKIETVDRVFNGIYLFEQIDKNVLFFGVNNSNCSDYVKEHHLSGNLISLSQDSDLIYLPTFWETLFKYGIVGLLLYLSIYIRFLKKERSLLPFVVNGIVSMFYGGDGLQAFFMYSVTFMAVYEIQMNSNNIDNKCFEYESGPHRIRVRKSNA